MITPKEFIRKWDEGPFMRINADALASTRLPESAKIFLSEAGLPCNPEFYDMVFDTPPDRIIRLPEIRLPQITFPDDYDCYIKIGSISVAHICIDESRSGNVVSVDNDLQVTFVNSSVPQLAEVLFEYRRISLQLAEKQDDLSMKDLRRLLEESARELETEIKRIDPVALEDQDKGWWPVTIEDILVV